MTKMKKNYDHTMGSSVITKKKKKKKSNKNVETHGIEVNNTDAENTYLYDSAPYDENLLQRSRTQWQFGDWEGLTKIHINTLQDHPDRARLSILVAAGHIQLNNMDAAKEYIRMAKDWGCDFQLISRVLISGVYNSLGRATSLAGNSSKGLIHFENSIKTVLHGNEARFIVKARSNQQLEELGLLPGSDGRLQHNRALNNLKKQSQLVNLNKERETRNVNHEAYTFYNQLDDEKNKVPFLLLVSRTLPRSGLHYLKNTLSNLLGDHFSFCEWYQEPGCCKKMPCALTSFASFAREHRDFRIRLTKSHDFELTDPIIDSNKHCRQLIIVRDPLFILTSWFLLEQLRLHRDILKKYNLKIEKVWLTHEKELLESAYTLLDQHFREPTAESISSWLSDKSRYIIDFWGKWVSASPNRENNYSYIINYEEINSFIVKILNEFLSDIPNLDRKKLDKFEKQSLANFSVRNSPFDTYSEKVSACFEKHAMLFHESARQIQDAIKLLK